MKLRDKYNLGPLDLRTEIKMACWFAINDAIHEAGAREEKVWNESDPKDIEIMKVLDTKTLELTNRIMEIINENKG